MSAEENKTILLRFYDELRKGNLDAVDQYCAPNFAFHSPNFPNWPRGLDGARRLAGAWPTMFSEGSSTIDDIIAAGDKVVVRITMCGTYIGEPRSGFPKPGEKFSMGGVAIYRMVDGKIVDDWGIQVSCPQVTDIPWG